MTTSQNPFGQPARPAQPSMPMPHNNFGGFDGAQRVGRHSAPAAPGPAAWAPGPQQVHQSSHGYPQHGGHAPQGNGYAPAGAGPVQPGAGYAPAGARPQSGVAPTGVTFGAPSATQPHPGHSAQLQAGHPAQPQAGHPAPPMPVVPTQRSAENPVPGYPTGGGPAPRAPRNGLGTTALVLGILAVLFAMIPIIGVIAWPLAILGLVFGIVGVARTRSGKADNKGVAISGTVLSAAGLILCILWVAAFSSAVSSATPTGTAPATGSTSSGTSASAGAFPGALSDDVVGNAGDTLTVGDMQVTATALTPGDSTLGRTLCTTVTYRNTGSSMGNFSGIGDWKLQDPSGAALMTGLVGSTSPLSTGELAPGGTTTGDVCFDAKNGAAGQHVLLFDPMLTFTSGRGAWLNQVG